MISKNKKILFNHTVFTLLKSLTNKEKKQFSYFLQSAYFNTDTSLVRLFVAIERHILKKEQHDEELLIIIYQEIFQEKETKTRLNKNQKKLLSNKMSELTNLLKTFLAIAYMEKNEAFKNNLIYEALLEKRQLNICNRQLKRDKKKLSKEKNQNLEYHIQAHQIEKSKFKYLHLDDKILEQDNIAEVNFNLDMYYLISKLKIHTTAISLQRMSTNNKTYDFTSFDALIQLLSLPQYSDLPIVKIYLTIVQLMVNRKEKSFFKLLDLLNESHHFFTSEDLDEFYTVALNFCMSKIRSGELKYNDYVLDLYQIMEARNLHIKNGSINTRRLRNLVSQSCKVGNYKWAEDILNKYISFVPSKDRDNVHNFNLGAIAFYKKDYKKAFSYLIRVESKLGFYDINNRMLLLKSYYQLDQEYDERTIREFRNTEQHIKNNRKLTTNQRKGYKNFMRLLNNLYRLKYGVGTITFEKLNQMIESTKPISDKTWLKNTIAELAIERNWKM